MYYQLSFYVPDSHLEEVKNALFDIGVGRQGEYDQTCWQCSGQGQFRPLANSNPAIGLHEELTFVPEYKVEMLCSEELIEIAVKTLKDLHPYEEPAYNVIKLESL